MYDLAMTLVELGQTSKGDSVLIQLVHRFPNTPLSVDARIRLARHASEQGAWRDVEKWCSQAMELQCSEQLKPHVLAMRGQAYAQLGKPDPAIADFHTALANPDLGLDLQIAIRFHLSESLYLQEKWREAEPHWQWLSSIIASQTASKAKSEDWHPIVLLRSAEMLAVKKEWKRAEEIVLSIRNDFPECSKRAEVDYLYARCLVSKADFEAARTALAMLAQSEGSHAELYARGNWMIGETYLMQRRHAEACLAYQQVLDIPQQPNWHAAALLQIGHCHEATSDLLKARTAYERILNVFPDSPYVSTAQSRLNRIPSQSHLQTADAKNATGPKR
jgi:cellulose synthase operon protein C